MAELYFSRDEIEGLARQLASLESLSPPQRNILVAIFSAARNNVRLSPVQESGSTDATVGDLVDQLVNAFIPGGGSDFTITDEIKVGPGPGGQQSPE